MIKHILSCTMVFGLLFSLADFAHANAIKEGSFRQSCKEINVDKNGITALCQKKDGSWQKTSLSSYNFPCTDISNNNGELLCHSK